MTLAHVGDVLMAGTYGGGLEINVPVENKKAISEMRCRLVLLGLAYHANNKSFAWPSARTLGEELKIPESKVRVALKILEQDGWIKFVGGYKPGIRGKTYLLTLPSFTDPNNTVDANSPHLVTQVVTHGDTQVMTEDVAQRNTQLGTPACDKEEVKVKHKEKEEILLTFELATDLFQAFWDCYPRKSSPDKKARAEWNLVIEKVGITTVTSALIQLLSVPLQEGKGYQPAHEWLADLVDKS